MVSFEMAICLFWGTGMVLNSPELTIFRLKKPKYDWSFWGFASDTH